MKPTISGHKLRFLEEAAPQARLARGYLEAMLARERNHATDLIMAAVASGTPIRDIYLQVLQPVQYEIGWLWQSGRITVGHEHYCTNATQLVMSLLYPRLFSGEAGPRRMLAACVEGELHELGLRMLTDFFEMDGWDTDFLDVSIIESGHLALDRTPTDSDRVVDNAVALVERIAAREAVSIRIEGGDATRRIDIDGPKVEQVVANLLDNAVRHSPADAVVRVLLEQDDACTAVSVIDQGPGIPESQREKIFRPYHSGAGKRAKGHKGAGLGLVIALKVAREHGGDITVSSQPGSGAMFRLSLPNRVPALGHTHRKEAP